MEKEIINLKCEPRNVFGKKVKTLRKENKIPAIVYGKEISSVPVAIDIKNFKSIFEKAGTSTLVSLLIEGEKNKRKVIIHEPQNNPVTGSPIHVDFYQVNMKEKIKTEIPLEFIGESVAVIDLEGNLITHKDALEVECLPEDLISEIKVDISVLKTFEDNIKVEDIKVPEGIEILDDKEEVIAAVTEPRSEDELEATLAEPTAEAEASKIEELAQESEEEETTKAEEPEK